MSCLFSFHCSCKKFTQSKTRRYLRTKSTTNRYAPQFHPWSRRTLHWREGLPRASSRICFRSAPKQKQWPGWTTRVIKSIKSLIFTKQSNIKFTNIINSEGLSDISMNNIQDTFPRHPPDTQHIISVQEKKRESVGSKYTGRMWERYRWGKHPNQLNLEFNRKWNMEKV